MLDLAEDPASRNRAGWVPGIPAALRLLGTAAVPRARAWAASGDTTLNQLAVMVLSESGDREDGGYLLSALTRACETGDWCAAEIPAAGLGRLRLPQAAAALASAWQATIRSCARKAIFEGLRGCAGDTIAGFAIGALDDCEPPVQAAACEAAPDTPETRQRLRDLRDDPLAPEAHQAARLRLQSHDG